MPHLTPAELIAYRDGELHDSEVSQHLANCEKCQAELSRMQRFAAYIKRTPNEDSTHHPTDEVLAAYCDRALPAHQMALIEEHIKNCERCTTLLKVVRETLQDLEG